jgi:hypothetical protein
MNEQQVIELLTKAFEGNLPPAEAKTLAPIIMQFEGSNSKEQIRRGVKTLGELLVWIADEKKNPEGWV